MSATAAECRRLHRQRILIVEDDRTLSCLLRDVIESEGGEVRVAHGAAHALAVADTFVPELILLDVSLPDGNGYDLCARWRGSLPAPVVFMSGRAGSEDLARARAAGGRDYLAKPFSLHALLERLCLALSGPGARRAV